MMKDRKSSVDILEHVTAGGVEVQNPGPRPPPTRETGRESFVGGIVGADVESRTRPLEPPHRTADEGPHSSRRR